ncbi:DUF108 domain-containing protein [Rhodobacterales bacterium HKCCE3408]|nr:DUF108 domain-containing protein [Rhodobacterales bacterium HKCCE3408]
MRRPSATGPGRAPITVSVIGAGRIGSDVIDYLRSAPGLRLGRVLTRTGPPDNNDPETFLSGSARLIIDAAGPGALRVLGPRCLGAADLWTVGAAALADQRLLDQAMAAAEAAGTQLRLFAPWALGPQVAPRASIRSLSLTVSRPGLTAWRGSVREAASLFPDEVNFAVAAALNGPGLDRTEVEFEDSAPGTTHRIISVSETEAGTCTSSIEFVPEGRHPTALSLIAALEKLAAAVA